ncbi:MAG TPA: signal peptidase II [Candidatus Krumholzibacteria bacterium]|nr:signal peptidase II [Candidatus Krumholzibacteria bacterium]
MGLFLPAAIVVVLDQLTKHFVWRNGQNYEVIPGYFNITLVKNAGAAFGMFQGARIFFVAASVLAVGLIVYLGRRLPREYRQRRIWLGLILGGAVGNLIDRVASGQVIDFLQIGVAGHYWPVFNVADAGVSIGAALLILYALRTRRSLVPAAAPSDEPTPSPADDSQPR